MKALFLIVFFALGFPSLCQNDSVPVSYFDPVDEAWKDALFIDKEPIILDKDTFTYSIKGYDFLIVQTRSIDTMWYYTDEIGLFPVHVDTLYEQTSIDQPKPVEIYFTINEARIDTIRSADDPRIILAIDTILGPHEVNYLTDFLFEVYSSRQIASQFNWIESLAQSQPGLHFGMLQIDTYSKPHFAKGEIHELPSAIEEAWRKSSTSIRLWIYTFSNSKRRYPDLEFLVHLIKE